MSIIIAAKVSDRVVMIADSAELIGERVAALNIPERLKIIRINDVLIGSAGSVKNIRHLIENPEWFDTKGEPFDKKFIVTCIVPKLYRELEEYNHLEFRDDIPTNAASVIMSHKDKIFYMDNSLAVHEIDKVTSVGCTKELIRPLLIDMKDGEELETMISAMRMSSYLSPAVRPPYYYVDTKTMKFTTIKE